MERKKNKLKGSNASNTVKIRVGILIILHIVGLIGFMIPQTRELFRLIVPLHLLVISIVLFWEKSSLEVNFWVYFILSFFIGFVAEAFGVKSGLLFGYYHYSDYLFVKLIDVPIVIGILWASVSYATNQISKTLFPDSVFFAVLLNGLLMVLFDYIMEPFAVHSGLWIWEESKIPAYNYLCWFGLGLILGIIYNYTFKDRSNKVAIYFISIQILFFIFYQILNGLFSLSPF